MENKTAVSLIAKNFNLLSDKDFKSWFLNNLDYLTNLERQQIINAHKDSAMFEMDSDRYAEQYYNETFTKSEPK